MSDDGRPFVEALHREAAARLEGQPLPPVEPPSIPWTELPEAKPGEPLAEEWNTYRREVGRLLAEGHEGKYILIKATEIIGLYDSWTAARTAGITRYLLEPFLVRPIRASEPHLRIRGLNFPCPG